jgi:hypothetical protein
MSNAEKKVRKLSGRSFDLTTEAGRSEALQTLENINNLLMLANPGLYFAQKLLDKAVGIARENINSTESTIQEQRQAAIDIIKAGKENNASSLEITMDQKAGIDLGTKFEEIPLKFSVGKSGKMTIKVEYK